MTQEITLKLTPVAFISGLATIVISVVAAVFYVVSDFSDVRSRVSEMTGKLDTYVPIIRETNRNAIQEYENTVKSANENLSKESRKIAKEIYEELYEAESKKVKNIIDKYMSEAKEISTKISRLQDEILKNQESLVNSEATDNNSATNNLSGNLGNRIDVLRNEVKFNQAMLENDLNLKIAELQSILDGFQGSVNSIKSNIENNNSSTITEMEALKKRIVSIEDNVKDIITHSSFAGNLELGDLVSKKYNEEAKMFTCHNGINLHNGQTSGLSSFCMLDNQRSLQKAGEYELVKLSNNKYRVYDCPHGTKNIESGLGKGIFGWCFDENMKFYPGKATNQYWPGPYRVFSCKNNKVNLESGLEKGISILCL